MNILLDMDGVIADFHTQAIGVLNTWLEKRYTTEMYVNECVGWDMWRPYGIDCDTFVRLIDETPNFWIDIPPYPWAKELYDYCMEIGEGNVTICTTPFHDPACSSQKQEWLSKHLGINSSSVMLGSRKYLMAKPGNVLVDDYNKNINRFIKEGGDGALVPSSWNTHNVSFQMIKNAIDKVVYSPIYA